jgi:hypothetical protein
VAKGKQKIENPNMKLKKAMDEDKKLTEMMLTKKNKRLYDKIMYSKKKQNQEVITKKKLKTVLNLNHFKNILFFFY